MARQKTKKEKPVPLKKAIEELIRQGGYQSKFVVFQRDLSQGDVNTLPHWLIQQAILDQPLVLSSTHFLDKLSAH
ncbi:MAG: hypothetical protein NTZ65_03210 [Candidatus Berkelbacteria bacterium]|nr:hypothetical protein [Candidatus Berkelbacteria bacterium]